MDSETNRVQDDGDGRRNALAALADYLKQQKGALTDKWLLAVRRDPDIGAADRLTHQQLVDHLPEIYDECCDFLRTRNASALVDDARADAKIHGEIRWADGYRIDELIRELEVFRRILAVTVARYGEVDARFHGPLMANASSMMEQFFGEVTVHSVAQFASEQQRVVQTYTSQLEAANMELARTNASLQQALTERQRLTAIIAHEVRNFLQGLSPALAASRESANPLGPALRDVEALLSQLLEHTSLIANREPLHRDEFDPVALHQELMRAYLPAAEQRGLALVGSCEQVPRRVVADRLKVRQIVSNLLANAIKYTDHGHVALVFAPHDGQRWSLKVSDTGPGLSAQAADRLFGGLVGAHDTVPQGGIGLSITKDLVDLLGGSMSVITKSGSGTVIEVLLPLSAVPVAT